MVSKLRVSLCQILTVNNKSANIKKAVEFISKAANRGSELVILPECFNCPCSTRFYEEYAEKIEPGSPTFDAMSCAARDNHVWLIAGSIPERAENGKIYNTSMTFGPDGKLKSIYRKIHLFQLNFKELSADESAVISPGDTAEPVEMNDNVKFGVIICFDIRYPLLTYKYAEAGTSFIVCPAVFNMVTGPLHWELTARTRAVDNQQYMLMCSGARDENFEYVAYGHSMVVDPYGKVIAELDEKEGVIDAELNLDLVREVRERLPILRGVRHDLYKLEWKITDKSEGSEELLLQPKEQQLPQ